MTFVHTDSARAERLRGGTCQLLDVTFIIPAVAARTASVVGEFNDWSPTAHPMTRDGDGYSVTITVPAGRAYRFRYLLDGERWQNDWTADSYVPNEFGGDDSVIDLTDAATPTALAGG
ncbi:MAG: isoamylase early set domain-containing protein [Ilumatobacteraceae bacterium]